MKIIGVLGGAVTVVMSTEELGKITGHQCQSDSIECGDGRWTRYDIVGVVKIREGWERLHLLTKNRTELMKAQRQLRAIADVLEPLELVVLPETEEEKAAKAAEPSNAELAT